MFVIPLTRSHLILNLRNNFYKKHHLKLNNSFAACISTSCIQNAFKKFVDNLKFDKDYHFEEKVKVPDDFTQIYSDFMPNLNPTKRNKMKEKIEREEMIKRRYVIDIPEFYPGSILAVTVADPNATGKINRFVGVCIDKQGHGLHSGFSLRNIVDRIGVEIEYDTYCPLIHKIECLRLEKRLDSNIRYIRECDPEICTIPFDMDQEFIPDGPAPLNTVVEKPVRPFIKWREKWYRQKMKGFELPILPIHVKEFKGTPKNDDTRDLMFEYRHTVLEEEVFMIYKQLLPHLPKFDAARRPKKTDINISATLRFN